MISRRQARRPALFLVYQWDLSGEIGSQYGGEIDPVGAGAGGGSGRARARARRAHHRRLRGVDGRPARRGRAERPARRDPGARRGEVPHEVAIDEAVGLTKRYASDEGARLVNGFSAGSEERRHDGRIARRAEELLARLEAARARLEGRPTTPSRRSRCCRELAELAKEIEAELQRARPRRRPMPHGPEELRELVEAYSGSSWGRCCGR